MNTAKASLEAQNVCVAPESEKWDCWKLAKVTEFGGFVKLINAFAAISKSLVSIKSQTGSHSEAVANGLREAINALSKAMSDFKVCLFPTCLFTDTGWLVE